MLEDARIVFLGEQHDNPAHHARQAELVADLAPAALVFEMLTEAQAGAVTPALVADRAALEAALGWADSGWPDFAMYHPIFAAAPGAAVYGAALPRAEARQVMEGAAADVFGAEADRYGLTVPLPADQQEAREALQAAAHCDVLPVEMLPGMVEVQRLRDAFLARAALAALDETGGPVVVITGNGHARRDWGAPAFLARVAPDVPVATLGQGEASHGAPKGGFDAVEIGPDVDRGDPCDSFATR
ncbi:ChaN family lipoprotein [Roseivivax isoporae]|nr:ChaN family lipoprotein [Roseivivax isoporae]